MAIAYLRFALKTKKILCELDLNGAYIGRTYDAWRGIRYEPCQN